MATSKFPFSFPATQRHRHYSRSFTRHCFIRPHLLSCSWCFIFMILGLLCRAGSSLSIATTTTTTRTSFLQTTAYCATATTVSLLMMSTSTTAATSSNHADDNAVCSSNNNSFANNNSTIMPHPIGLGTYMIPKEQARDAIRSAILTAGYRRIDCAPVYFNEDAIGDALQEILLKDNATSNNNDNYKIQRQDLYIVSKLPSPFHTAVETAVRKTLADLRLDYLDLYLVHWPVAFYPLTDINLQQRGWENEDIDESDNGKRIDPTVSIHDTWRQMEALVEKGLVKQIGVSNFPVMLLHELLTKAKIPPAVNQCEAHPYLTQDKLVQYCRIRGIHFQAYSPLGSPGYIDSLQKEPVVLQDPLLAELATKYQTSPSRICLAWALQRGTSVVVKSVRVQHQVDNLLVASSSSSLTAKLPLRLSEEDMKKVSGLNRNYRFFRPEDWWGDMGMAVFD